ncbi:MAG: polysaccharide deacetylase family protein, partial [Nitrospirae bacterium]|nr:polysaccharide deacetylase family protein [Candidatus Manganitrophaceae bacterium]
MKSIKNRIALVVKSLVYQSGIDAMKRRLVPSAIPVIARYHSVCSDSNLISAGIRITPEAFTEQVAYFAKYFHVIKMNHLIEQIQNREAFPKNTLVLTFDDGYADNLGAAKVLQQYGLTGLFYITAGCIESDEAFWVAEVRHLIENTKKKEMTLPLPDRKCCIPLSNAEQREQAIKKMTRLFKSVTIETRENIRKVFRFELDDTPSFPKDLMLNWPQLREMVEMGMEIGGHTMT